MGGDAGGDVGEAFAVRAAAGGAEAGEVVLGRADVAGEAQGAGLEHHLEEGDVPADTELLAVAHVLGSDVVEAAVDLRIAGMQIRHQTTWRGAGRYFVGIRNSDFGKVGRLGWNDDGGKSESERYSEKSLHENTRCERGAAFFAMAPYETNKRS